MHAHVDGDLALLGELHGVAAEVHENLAQARRVALDEIGHGGIDVRGELQALAVRLDGEQARHVFDGVAQVELDVLEIELAGFDLGEVENVVDDGEQRASRCRGSSRCSRAGVGSRPVSSSSSVMPITPFIGVRISWLMLARNSPLARFAAADASRRLDQIVLILAALGDVLQRAGDADRACRSRPRSQMPRERNQRYSPVFMRTRNSAS